MINIIELLWHKASVIFPLDHSLAFEKWNQLFHLIIRTPLSLILLTSSLHSQPNCSYSNGSNAEKIYLQLDSKVYTTDKIIWFKSIVTNTKDHTLSKMSGLLNVELISPDEVIMEKKLISLNNGIGHGFFELDQSYAEGLYQIRAYTEWNKNFGNDFFYKEYIQVFQSKAGMTADPIEKITMVDDQISNYHLSFWLNPSIVESLYKNKLKIILKYNELKDTLTVSRNKQNKYFINYIVPNTTQFITIIIQTLYKNYSKTISLNENQFDLQFFPESGEIVDGLHSKVGFKAVNFNGKGIAVEGEIINSLEEIVTSFKSNQLGMGFFTIPFADVNTTYFARLKNQSNRNFSNMFKLPAVSPKGNVLSVIKIRDKIRLAAISNYLKDDSINLSFSCRGELLFIIKGFMNNGILAFLLEANKLPEGIIAITLMDNHMNPMAERLYFNERKETRMNLLLTLEKDTFRQRELTRVNIEAKNNNGEPLETNLSLLVVNNEQLEPFLGNRQNILSYFLLSSELKGEIEDPGFYFNTDCNRQNDLEALLLTQGWRKYNYSSPIYKILFEPEPFLSISGTTFGMLSTKKRKVADLTLMTFGKTKSVHTLRTDSLGRFKFNLENEYGDKMNILIQSANKHGKNWDYTINLDKRVSPPIIFDQAKTIGKVDSVVNHIVKKNIERKLIEDSSRFSVSGILLDEVVVEGQLMTPTRKVVIEKHGTPDEIINGKDIERREKKWSFGLYSVLMFNFSNLLRFDTDCQGNIYARVKNSGITLILMDGQPVKSYEYSLIPNIPPSEVKCVDVIENAKNISSIFLEYNPFLSPFDVPNHGNIIAIYTHTGKGIYGIERPIGIVKSIIPVFSSPREFYCPKYENAQAIDSAIPDLRSLVHWDPIIQSDSLGKATLSFYNGDITGDMILVVEGISELGEIGYQKLVYNVVKNERLAKTFSLKK